MSQREADFLRRLRATFLVEAREHLQAVSSGIAALQRATAPDERAIELEKVFRHTHSLKGAARATGFGDIEALCQAVEELFARVRRQQLLLTADAFDTLHRTFDRIDALVALGETGEDALPASATPDDLRVLADLQALLAAGLPAEEPDPAKVAAAVAAAYEAADTPEQPTDRASTPEPADTRTDSGPDAAGPVPAPAPIAARTAATTTAKSANTSATVAAPPPLAETVRVSVPQLDRMLLAAEEMLAMRQAAARHADELLALAPGFAEWNARWATVQVALRRLRKDPAASDLLAFLEWNFGHVRALEGRVRALGKAAVHDRQVAAKQVDELLAESKELLMLPFGTLGALLQKSARELARDQDKQVEPLLVGSEVLIDKRVLEQLKDPLLHLVRNAVDHGIEAPSVRVAAGKAARGSIEIRAALVAGGMVEISIADDGAGIDAAAVRTAASKRGVASCDELARLDDAQVVELVFRSDLSTSPMITAVSGHGLGLAIVRDQVAALGGQLQLENLRPQGVRLRISVPQRMAAFRGVLVRLGEQVLVLPTAHVERVVRLPAAAVRSVENRETLPIDGQAVALVRLHDVLEMAAPDGARDGLLTVVVLGSGGERVAFHVDEVLHDEEVLVKRLRRPLLRVRNVAGATVLSSGRVAPILDAADLLKSARHASPRASAAAPATPEAAVARRILVAEDSITSRMLLKGILEAAGYEVRTAVDGIEAYTALRSEAFDLLVSDVEMPRLDGFGLTARVRADRHLAELPVVLVTALSTREDRERGIDVGASAYIPKGSFDQRELVDAVRRLIGSGDGA